MERRTLPDIEFRIAEESGKRTLSFYASVFDAISEDLGGFREKIGRRAFTKTLSEQDVYACFNHNPDNLLGRTSAGTLKLRTDLTGLLATVELPDTQLGADIAHWVDRGDLRGASFAFRTIRDRWTTMEDGTPLREVQECRLYDVSPVVSPAYPATDGSMALRAAFANLIDLDKLAAPLLRVRAGLPLDLEERRRFADILDRLRSSVPEPPATDDTPTGEPDAPTGEQDAEERSVPDDGHSWRLAHRRRQLELLRLRGGL